MENRRCVAIPLYGSATNPNPPSGSVLVNKNEFEIHSDSVKESRLSGFQQTSPVCGLCAAGKPPFMVENTGPHFP